MDTGTGAETSERAGEPGGGRTAERTAPQRPAQRRDGEAARPATNAVPATNALARAGSTGAGVAKVEVVTTRAGFAALERDWEALADRCRAETFFRHPFLRVWLDNFAPGAVLRVLTLREADGRLSAALPLVWERTRMYGMPVRALSAPANYHSCRFDLLAEDAKTAAQAFLARLRAEKDWDVIRINDVPEGGRAFALYEEARAEGLPCGTWESMQSPYIPLPSTWEAFEKSVSSKFRGNLRRRRKRLEEKGKVEVEKVTSGLSLPRVLDEGLRLEASGWKGRGGTAMTQDAATRGFYTELSRNASHTGELALWFLRLDGRAVAFQYALEDKTHGRFLLLKPGYDEAIRECSPGQLLMEDVLRDCVARGMTEFDFLGMDMPWKRDWTERVRKHTWLFIFRDAALGRALHALKFRFGPKAREMVDLWKR